MVLGDIPSGENRRIVTAPLGINDNPAIDSEPGIARQFEIQIDADPHHYRIEGFRWPSQCSVGKPLSSSSSSAPQRGEYQRPARDATHPAPARPPY